MRMESIAFGVTYALTNALLVMFALQAPTVSTAGPVVPTAQIQDTAVSQVA